MRYDGDTVILENKFDGLYVANVKNNHIKIVSGPRKIETFKENQIVVTRELNDQEKRVLYRENDHNVPILEVPDDCICGIIDYSGEIGIITGPKKLLINYYHTLKFIQGFDGELTCFLPLQTTIKNRLITIQTKDLWTIQVECSYEIEFNKKDNSFTNIYIIPPMDALDRMDIFIKDLFRFYTIYDILYKPKEIEIHFPCSLSESHTKRNMWIIRNFHILSMNVIDTQAEIIPTQEQSREIVQRETRMKWIKIFMCINPFIGAILSSIIWFLLFS